MANLIPEIEKLTAEQEAQRATWQYRVVKALGGNLTWAGTCIVFALDATHHRRHKGPALVAPFTIRSTGEIFGTIRDPQGRMRFGVPLGTVGELRDALNRVADQLHLTDEERIAMFNEIKKCIARDERAESGIG